MSDTQAKPVMDTTLKIERDLIAELRKAAEQIAAEGHAGWGNACRDAAQTLASKDALIQSQADEIGRMRKRLIAYADSMYCNSLEIFRRPECLGWEQKVKSNQYTEVEHEAHRRANEAMGAHRGIYAALKLFDAESATTQPKETS